MSQTEITPPTLNIHVQEESGTKTITARTYVARPDLAQGDEITIRVRMHEPNSGLEDEIKSFTLPYERDMRVIDLLHTLSDRGESLGYRWFCSTKKCGGCGMKVNGEPKLACWEPVDGRDLLLEPLDGFPVLRDLVTDRRPAQSRSLSLKPYVERKEVPAFPEPLTHKQIKGSYELMSCIECGICTSACPAYTGADGEFPGPWALVQAAKFARDPRDKLDREVLIESSGADHCMSCYRCEQVCPVHIPIVTEAIMPLRGMAARGPTGAASHPLDFAENIRKNGFAYSPSLFLKTKGLRGSLRSFPLAFRMMTRGKMRFSTGSWKNAQRGIAKLFAIVADNGGKQS